VWLVLLDGPQQQQVQSARQGLLVRPVTAAKQQGQRQQLQLQQGQGKQQQQQQQLEQGRKSR
jgi:hypothetical protein